MKKLLVFAISYFGLSCFAFGQDLAVQLAQADGKKITDYKTDLGGSSLVRISVQNQSKETVTVSYVGIGSGAALVKVADRDINAASEAFFPVLIDNDALGVASNVDISIGYAIGQQLKVQHATTTLAATDILSFSPGFLSWKVGEALKEKSATISVPKNTKLGKLPAIEGFSLRVDGNVVYVTPTSTASAATTAVFLKVTPATQANRVLPLGLTITQ